MKEAFTLDQSKRHKEELVVEGDKFVLNTKQDIAPVIEHAKFLKSKPPGKNFRHVAEIPLVIYHQAVREGWSEDQNAWKRFLNNPDNKLFRSWEGKV
jgi:hypothetical protein